MEVETLDAVARFHRALVDEIVRSRPSYLSEPFTVAEIYQNLVPYRTHRDRIGVEMNGDYEDALLRLLAGEGEYLQLESEHAVGEIRAELAAPNPNTGLYRAYAAADVRLNPLRLPPDLPEPSSVFEPLTPAVEPSERTVAEPPRASEPAAAGPVEAPAPPPTPSPVQSPAVSPAASSVASSVASPAAGSAASGVAELVAAAPVRTPAAPASMPSGSHGAGSSCAWCREPLPKRDVLNFCPFCGGNVHTAPCTACGEELETAWRFCVSCGTAVGERG